MKILGWIVIASHLLLSIGALAAGYACMQEPMGPIGAPITLLEGSPFLSFFLPGLFLFTVIGLGNLVSAFLLAKFSLLGKLCSMGMGFIMMLWIIIQCSIIKDIVALHVITFALGLLQLFYSLILLIRNGDLRYLLSEL
ncbi:MAG: hypothetical protein EOM68_25705 [Spirochaetia bacterium]|jgi:hypothetical protein|nr:hypothetical protein [Spirochaetia bacterium]NLK05209.1 hypothetical protein [Spirochaetales bacterium]